MPTKDEVRQTMLSCEIERQKTPLDANKRNIKTLKNKYLQMKISRNTFAIQIQNYIIWEQLKKESLEDSAEP